MPILDEHSTQEDIDAINRYLRSCPSKTLYTRTPEQLARSFHEIYEKLAPQFNYETRKDSAVPWENVPENNKKLMIAVCAQILKNLENSPHGSL